MGLALEQQYIKHINEIRPARDISSYLEIIKQIISLFFVNLCNFNNGVINEMKTVSGLFPYLGLLVPVIFTGIYTAYLFI